MANARYLNFQKTLWPLFMYGVQLPQGYRATTMTQFTFPHQSPGVPATHLINLRRSTRLGVFFWVKLMHSMKNRYKKHWVFNQGEDFVLKSKKLGKDS